MSTFIESEYEDFSLFLPRYLGRHEIAYGYAYVYDKSENQ